MERIVLEVDDDVAKAWHDTSIEKRKQISSEMNVRISKQLFVYNKDNFVKYLDDLGDKMAERGLTQEILDDILSDD